MPHFAHSTAWRTICSYKKLVTEVASGGMCCSMMLGGLCVLRSAPKSILLLRLRRRRKISLQSSSQQDEVRVWMRDVEQDIKLQRNKGNNARSELRSRAPRSRRPSEWLSS